MWERLEVAGGKKTHTQHTTHIHRPVDGHLFRNFAPVGVIRRGASYILVVGTTVFDAMIWVHGFAVNKKNKVLPKHVSACRVM